MAVNLYGKSLFGNAYKSAVIRGMNNAPGGAGGVDDDVQHRLGAPGGASMMDRKHGICCGITVAWIIGVCHKREDAVNTTGFDDYFRNVLRFQGSYIKDFKGNVDAMDELQGIQTQGLGKTASGRCNEDQLSGRFPSRGAWASYLGLYHHAVGIGYSGSRYLIMDPNAGLFKYKGKSDFISDVKALCDARRQSKGGGADFRFTIFKKT
ncbi:MAG: hypothetical protein OEY03_12300 [Rhizobacter sp.]|nr:hypothetical protein [Rhizobacter sp.]